MQDRKPLGCNAAALGKAPGSNAMRRVEATEAKNDPGKSQRIAGLREGAGGAEARQAYGVVLKGGNDFVASTGVTGAATAKIDIPSDTADLVPDGTCSTMKPPKSGG